MGRTVADGDPGAASRIARAPQIADRSGGVVERSAARQGEVGGYQRARRVGGVERDVDLLQRIRVPKQVELEFRDSPRRASLVFRRDFDEEGVANRDGIVRNRRTQRAAAVFVQIDLQAEHRQEVPVLQDFQTGPSPVRRSMASPAGSMEITRAATIRPAEGARDLHAVLSIPFLPAVTD